MSEVWRETFCMGCGCGPSEPHHHNCATHEQDWADGERRMDAIGANGNDGLHYAEDSDRGSALSQALGEKQPRYQDKAGDDWIDEFARTATADEFRGAMRFTVGKYNRRVGKKDSELSEVRKMRDYCQRWEAYLVARGDEQ